MSTVVKVKYFNSFWLKKVVGSVNAVNPCTTDTPPIGTVVPSTLVTSTVNYAVPAGCTTAYVPLPTWPGIPWNPSKNGLSYPTFPWGEGFVSCFPTAEEGEERQWFVEEARIRGGYNNVSVDFGKKAYIVEDTDIQQHRSNGLIYSGVYNSRTGVNETNVFSVSQNITTAVDPAFGSIQKLYAYHNNLDILQENKCSHALIDKDAIYTAEGKPMQTQSNVVIGQVVPYLGEYGISKNPESFATYGYARYFADQNRGCILRLSRDGITEISQYGMRDYFRDKLSILADAPVSSKLEYLITTPPTPGTFTTTLIVQGETGGVCDAFNTCPCSAIPVGAAVSVIEDTGGGLIEITLNVYVVSVNTDGSGNCLIQLSGSVDADLFPMCASVIFRYKTQSKMIGGWDIHQKYYTLSIQNVGSISSCTQDAVHCDINNPCTLAFDEQINGWVSFFSYKPTQMFSLKDRFYTVDGKDLYEHYTNEHRNAFYGQPSTYSSISFVFNPKPSTMKNFNTISYEGSNGWLVAEMSGSPQEFDTSTMGGPSGWSSSIDTIVPIKSYHEGEYIGSEGYPVHAGFDRKENKYTSALRNASVATHREVESGASMSGIKGYYSTVLMVTDETTDPGGLKELWAVSSNYVISSK